MKKKKILLAAAGGLTLCGGFTAWAVWDAIRNHNGRLVYPMDSYAFQMSDIPVLLSIALDLLYLICVAAGLVIWGVRQNRQDRTANRTRKINPWLGLLGFFGFLGFLGFYTFPNDHQYFPFCFFVFFGFFGFFFEGKMSNTFMDERFRENCLRAQRDAAATGVVIAHLLLILVAGQSRASVDLALILLIIGLSLDMALTGFLSEYLLYRYDHDGNMPPEEE